ncbi:MAG: phosphoribosyltransferase family protein [Pseudomonadota bacterium]
MKYAALVRILNTLPQTNLDRTARLLNVRQAFFAKKQQVVGQHVLLVDDVMTTGATASACTEALLLAGAANVHILTLARAVP